MHYAAFLTILTLSVFSLCPDLVGAEVFAAARFSKGDVTSDSSHIHATKDSGSVQKDSAGKSPEIQELDKMIVIGRDTSAIPPSQIHSATRFGSFELTHTPGTANDINRVIASHPSVVGSASNEFDNALYVRGGHALENIYLIDGIEMINANHYPLHDRTSGKVSFINASLVKDLDFYTGAYPASSPPAMSSVIDIHVRNGSFTEPGLSADLSVMGLGITGEVPIACKASVLANVRFVDMTLLEDFLSVGGIPRYGDCLLKAVFAPDQNNTFTLTTVGAYDMFIEDKMYDRFHKPLPYTHEWFIYQAGGIAAWKYDNESIKNTLSLSGALWDFNNYDSFTGQNDTLTDSVRSFRMFWQNGGGYDTLWKEHRSFVDGLRYKDRDYRRHIMVKNDLSFSPIQNTLINLGISAGTYEYSVTQGSGFGYTEEYFIQNDSMDMPIPIDSVYIVSQPFDKDSSVALQRYSGYTELVMNRGIVKATLGVRGDYYTLLRDHGFSPRMGIEARFPSAGTISLSGGLQYQFPSEFTENIREIIAPKWHGRQFSVESLRVFDLQRCWHAIAGYQNTLPGGHDLALEGYYKWYDREYPYRIPNSREYYNPKTGDAFDNPRGEKKAYGIELHLKKSNPKRIYYSLSGALFSIKNKYTDSTWHNDKNNIRAQAGLSAGWTGRHHGIALRAILQGGRPYTPTETVGNTKSWGYTEYTRPSDNYYSTFLDPVATVNLRYSFKATPRWGTISGYVDIYNVFDHVTIIDRKLDFGTHEYEDTKNNGIIPVIGIEAAF